LGNGGFDDGFRIFDPAPPCTEMVQGGAGLTEFYFPFTLLTQNKNKLQTAGRPPRIWQLKIAVNQNFLTSIEAGRNGTDK